MKKIVRLLFVLVILGSVASGCSAFTPDSSYTFPSDVPEDLYDTYWLLLDGAAGSNLPGVQTEFTSPSDDTWVRKEAMWVDPKLEYVWTWEHDGKVEFDVRAENGQCVQIGDQVVQVSIEKGEKYWDYKVTKCVLPQLVNDLK